MKVLNEVYEKHLLRARVLMEAKMKISKINMSQNTFNKKSLSFKENSNINDNTAVLSLQGSNSLVNFEKDLNISKEADAVQSNPVKALFYKLYKTFKMFFGSNKNINPELEMALYTYA